MKRLDRDAFHWPDTPNELRQVTLKEIHWLCDGLSLDQKDAFEEHHPSSYKRRERTGKKQEDLSGFEVTETLEYNLTGEERYCPDCGKKYKVVTKETVKRLKFAPAKFEVVEEVTYVYSCPECGSMKRPEKNPPLD